MATQVDTSTTADATASGTYLVGVAPSDATVIVVYNGGGGTKRAHGPSPYTSWTLLDFGGTTGRNGQSIHVNSDDSLDIHADTDSSGGQWFSYTRSGAAYNFANSAGDTNFVGASDKVGVAAFIGKDVQGRLWVISLDDVLATYQFGCASAVSPYTTWTAATPDGTNLGETNHHGVAAAFIGNYLVLVYDSGSGGLSYRRVDVHNPSLGSWSAAAAVGAINDVTTSSVLALAAIPGGSTGVLAYSGGNGISALVYDAGGDTWAPPTVLSSAANDRHPALIAGASGNVYAVWAQFVATNSYALVGRGYGGSWGTVATLEASGNNIAWPSGAFLSGASKLGLLWTQGTVTPWSVEFDTVTPPVPGSGGGGGGGGGNPVMGSPTSPMLSTAGFTPVEVGNTPNVGASLNSAPEVQSNSPTAFWNAAAVLAGAFSTAVQNLTATWGKARITVISSAVNTYTVQVSYDNTTWYDLTQDNAGTLFTIAAVTGHLNVSRDLPGPLPPYIRLVAVGAATVTAGIMEYGL